LTFERWAERIYAETDLGRSVATSSAGVAGLTTYATSGDWVVAAFVAIIVFPIVRLGASGLHSRYLERRRIDAATDQAEALLDRLSDAERQVLHEFVGIGGSVMSYQQANRCGLPEPAVSSLKERGVMFDTMTADGMSEAFGVDVDLFDAAQRAFAKDSDS